MIQVVSRDDPTVEIPRTGETVAPDVEPEVDAPERIGRYALRDPIGSGGMGQVFRAHDPELDRDVAVKLLRTRERAASEEDRARLLREAQALAQLSHPNVVRVFDAGTADDRVYLTMELLSGASLRAWLRHEPPRTWQQIVDVFVDAARGLAAAHAVGIVHRDFKPANVHVGDDGSVKVIDFGLALATPGRSSSVDLRVSSVGRSRHGDTGADRLSGHLTEVGLVMGTPVFMAPEQHRGAEIDARCDQYALCVSLYRALYGVYPFEGRRPGELVRAKLTQAPQPPVRGVDVPRAIRAVVSRGLRPDPEARWPSIEALVVALTRATTARRRRLAWAAGAGIVATALAVAGWPRDAPTACDGATQLVDHWSAQRREEVGEALLGKGSGYAEDTVVRVHQVLDEWAASWVEAYDATCTSSAPPPQVQTARACLLGQRDRLSATVAVLTEAEGDSLSRAVSVARHLPSPKTCSVEEGTVRDPWPDDPAQREAVAEVRRALARTAALEDAGRYDAALASGREALTQAEKIGYVPLTVEAQFAVGSALTFLEKLDEAEAALSEAAFTGDEIGHDRIVLAAAVRLAFIVGRKLDRYDEGERWVRFGMSYLQRTTDVPAKRASLLNSWATVLDKKGDWKQAEQKQREALALWLEQPNAEMDVATAHNNLGLTLYAQGRHDEAIAEYEKVVQLREELLGPLHPDTGVAHNNLANALAELRRLDEAQVHGDRAFAIWSAGLGPDHPFVSASLHNLGMLAYRRGDLDVAEGKFRAAIELREKTLGPDHPDLASSYLNLGAVYSSRNDQKEAARLFRQAARILEAKLGPEHTYVLMARSNLAETLRLEKRLDEALAEQRDILQIRERTLRAGHPEIAKASLGLGYMLVDVEQMREAERALERAIAIYEKEASDPLELARARFMLAQAVVDRDAPRAVALANEAIDTMREYGEAEDERHDVEGWIREHGGDVRPKETAADEPAPQ